MTDTQMREWDSLHAMNAPLPPDAHAGWDRLEQAIAAAPGEMSIEQARVIEEAYGDRLAVDTRPDRFEQD